MIENSNVNYSITSAILPELKSSDHFNQLDKEIIRYKTNKGEGENLIEGGKLIHANPDN